MELIFVIIVIAIAISNAQNVRGRDGGSNKKNKGGASVWDQVDKSSSNLFKQFVGSGRLEQVTRGARDIQDVVNNVRRKTVQKGKKREADSYQKEQEAWRKKQEEERKRRDFEERQKKKLELQKKEAEQRRKALEREKREREEKALLEHCQVAQDKGCSVHKEYQEESSGTGATASSEMKADKGIKKQDGPELDKGYRVEEYLDPLTSSFYPKVDDYLSPTTASFYPNIDVTSFSLQNEMNVL